MRVLQTLRSSHATSFQETKDTLTPCLGCWRLVMKDWQWLPGSSSRCLPPTRLSTEECSPSTLLEAQAH